MLSMTMLRLTIAAALLAAGFISGVVLLLVMHHELLAVGMACLGGALLRRYIEIFYAVAKVQKLDLWSVGTGGIDCFTSCDGKAWTR